jgi:hypothetical protein
MRVERDGMKKMVTIYPDEGELTLIIFYYA